MRFADVASTVAFYGVVLLLLLLLFFCIVGTTDVLAAQCPDVVSTSPSLARVRMGVLLFSVSSQEYLHASFFLSLAFCLGRLTMKSVVAAALTLVKPLPLLAAADYCLLCDCFTQAMWSHFLGLPRHRQKKGYLFLLRMCFSPCCQ